MFGMTGNTAHIGGEAGTEAILPLKPFWDKLENFIAKGSGGGNKRVENNIEIHINAADKSADEITDMVINALVPKLQHVMANV